MDNTNKIDVLDHGYVILQDWMGTDLTPINAARSSFRKKSTEFSEADGRLMDYLTREQHFSPFRHAVLQFEINAPLIVARQLWKYITGGAHDEFIAWNEQSFRYVSSDLTFYIPADYEWRRAPANKKQGSDGFLSSDVGAEATHILLSTVDASLANFEKLLAMGVAPEQARLVLPANALYTAWYFTVSLQGLAHLLTERLDAHAMVETQQIATAMLKVAFPRFPKALTALLPSDLLWSLQNELY